MNSRFINHLIKTGRRVSKTATVLLVAWLLLLPIYAGADTADIAGLVDAFLSETKCPGVQVAIMNKHDSHPATISRGMASLSNFVSMTDDHICRVGSVTKLFTAVRIHMLIQEKKLAYETPLSTFFPNFPNADRIQIRHLLTHTSGLAEMLAIKDVFENLCKPLSAEFIMDAVAKADPLFAPGTAQKYCNTGFLILGKVVEKITGQPFETDIKSAVLSSLEMPYTRQGDDLTLVKKEVSGYNLSKTGEVIKAANASMIPPFATGNFESNARDIVRFVLLGRLLKENFIDNPPGGFWILDTGKPAVTKGSYKQLSYETGWQDGYVIYRFTSPGDMTLVGKAGMFPGFCAWFLYDAQTEYGLGITVNDETKTMDALVLAVNIFQAIRAQ